MDINVYLKEISSWLLSHGVRILLIIVLALIALKAAKILARRLFSVVQRRKDDIEFQKRTETLGSVIRHFFNIIIIIVATIMVMGEVGIAIGPVLTAAGVVGLSVGIGAQGLVKDFISGFFILFEDQIRVGDVIEIAGKDGVVEKINLRMTILRDMSGNVHYIPNGQINLVTNKTKDYSYFLLEIGIAYREDVDEVFDVIKGVDEALRSDPDYHDDIFEPIEIFGLDKFGDSSVIIKARTKTKPGKQWRVAREFNRRLKIKFDEKNIEIPFPHLTLFLGKDKQSEAPPLNVVIQAKDKPSGL
ncbi:MAG: mechanosensitive ion channel family protein [Thermodesulfobacteriota bacterium]|jgi:small conductance mechanosensitive channel|nr:MAG: mechanosensitive ion channel family protein [Thermodesulfobacteriota bacterium]